MDKFCIALFVGILLARDKFVSVDTVQKYIRNYESSKTIVPAKDIEETLNDLVLGRWLYYIYSPKEDKYYYIRYISKINEEKYAM